MLESGSLGRVIRLLNGGLHLLIRNFYVAHSVVERAVVSEFLDDAWIDGVVSKVGNERTAHSMAARINASSPKNTVYKLN